MTITTSEQWTRMHSRMHGRYTTFLTAGFSSAQQNLRGKYRWCWWELQGEGFVLLTGLPLRSLRSRIATRRLLATFLRSRAYRGEAWELRFFRRPYVICAARLLTLIAQEGFSLRVPL